MLKLKNLPRYLTDSRVSLVKKLALVVGVLYILSPADAIPDIIPIIGWLDDIGIMGLLVSWLMRELNNYTAAIDTPAEYPVAVYTSSKRPLAE